MNKHDRYVEQLQERIADDYERIVKHMVLSTKKCTQAEIDLLAFKKDEMHVYEVKCSYRKVKAKKQLKRIARLLKGRKKAFFYCGSADIIEQIPLRKDIH